MGVEPKHVFLSTAGMSPQVITESLYAIAHDESGMYQWPDELRVITTKTGAAKVMSGLMEQGQLSRLSSELGRPMPHFDAATHIHVIEDSHGNALDDARSIADHNAVANFIMAIMRELTAHPEVSVHASLAGGRKTMTFYMGYAMSLFGRAQDRLSHVLIQEGFENLKDFWFPTEAAAHRYISHGGEQLDASTAEVTLADIPFIRHRHNLPNWLQRVGDAPTVDFAKLVSLINLGDQPERIKVSLSSDRREIIIEDVQKALHERFALGLLEFAFYQMMARATLEGDATLTRPVPKGADKPLAAVFLDELCTVCLPEAAARAGDAETKAKCLAQWNDMQARPQLNEPTLQMLGSTGMKAQWFDDRKQKIKAALSERLPANLVERVGIAIIFDEAGQRVQEGASRPQSGGYGINVPVPSAIQLEVDTLHD